MKDMKRLETHLRRVKRRESYSNRVFNRFFVSLDAPKKELMKYGKNCRDFSDNGAGAQAIREPNHRPIRVNGRREDPHARLRSFRRFVSINFPRCLTVLDLIVKNGKNRKESICYLERALQECYISTTETNLKSSSTSGNK